MCAGDLDAVDAILDEIFALTGDDIEAGANIVINCPYAWALMARSIVLKERERLRGGRALAGEALRDRRPSFGDPETESWARGNRATLMAERGDTRGGAGAGAAQLRADRPARRRLLPQRSR